MILPPITIVMTTLAPDDKLGGLREEAAELAIVKWERHLVYDSPLWLHVADDGSMLDGYGIGPESPPASWWHGAVSFSRQEHHGVGASLNAGIAKALSLSPLFAYFVDDWALFRDFDLNPWAKLLMENENIGMVRLGPPHPGITGTVQMFPGAWALVLDRHNFAFGFRPALYHRRFIDAYGPFPEDTSSLECERIYNVHFATTPGPEIVYALPYPWEHVGGGGKDALSTEVLGKVAA